MGRTYLELVSWHPVDKGKSIVEILTNEPIFFDFSWNWKAQFIYLFPGDTLEFRTTTNDTIPFQFAGSRPYNELMFFSWLEAAKLGYLSNSGNYGLMVTNKLNFQYVADQTFERYQERLKFLSNHLASGKFSDQGREAIAKSLYYKYLTELLFPYMKAMDSDFDNSLVSNSYKKKLRALSTEFNKDSLMYLWDYKWFSFLYARFLKIEASGEKNTNLSSLLDFYKKKFDGRLRDFLLFDEICRNYDRVGDASQVFEVIDSVKDKAMRDTLMSIQIKSKKEFSQRALKTELEAPDGKKITLNQLFSMYQRKSIYLDFWATWCGPCLMEMPDSEKLTQEFKNDSIEFIYLSIDTEKKKWLKKITTLPAGKNAHHYMITDGPNFIKEMEIPSVPRYILIGKHSAMVTFNAPRPRSAEIRELISEHVRIRK